ncbi:hypothetical protein DYB37_012797 [Aphanomyces astaci]|uniref:Hyaluronan/mRNA-binding protein domain-containing protein n=1 Tax=Aphanomyces astaci TaxID=112090 RepID=A0A396ZWR2_APHAT|nr:hypothetical protein DYB36_009492 [Aphanomyces astaci]RHY02267.1 hypothetical protein DYB25_011835 [Aphanomyces astaci]RHY40494.1 hypothetical protein DYB38_007117 [Aphanomyces astaci]RHY48566.1 hypothetical protein DYB34_009710 [Aphanomyces astaci]RHY78733.1 hypothetical protein DYB30_009592 [Aphanomyces astaci]
MRCCRDELIIEFALNTPPTTFDMPVSRELKNKKNDHKDRHSRGRAGSGAEPKKGGAGGHNWGSVLGTSEADAPGALDRGDPNYDSSDDGKLHA